MTWYWVKDQFESTFGLLDPSCVTLIFKIDQYEKKL